VRGDILRVPRYVPTAVSVQSSIVELLLDPCNALLHLSDDGEGCPLCQQSASGALRRGRSLSTVEGNKKKVRHCVIVNPEV
jgi:hypothetical protein